jgi:hypothetical protein
MREKNHFLRSLTFAVALLCAGSLLKGQTVVVSADFQPNADFGGYAPVNFSGVESQAAAADPVFANSNVWNHPSVDPTVAEATINASFSNLVNSTGATTSVGISFTGTFSSAIGPPIDNSGSDGVENDYFELDGGNQLSSSITYTISGLPAGMLVSVFLYSPNFGASHGTDRGYNLTLNGTAVDVVSASTANNTALVNVMSTASGTITGTWTSDHNAEADWSGFQLSYTVPEPSTWAAVLVSAGLVSLIMRRTCKGSIPTGR